MDDEHDSYDEPDKHAGKPSHAPQPGLRDILKGTTADAWAVVERSRAVTGRPAQVWFGGLLGACVVFLAAILAVQRLDTPLTIALWAFVIAIVLLGYGLLIVSTDYGHGRAEFITNCVRFAAWVLGEGLGSLAVFVGVGALVWHISAGAAIFGLLLVVGTPALYSFTALAYGMVCAWHAYRKHQQGIVAAPLPAQPDGAPQA